MERLLTEHETSERTKRAVSTLQKDRVVGGGIPFVKVGRQVRYRESDVQHYIESLPSYRSTSELMNVEAGLNRVASMPTPPPVTAINTRGSAKLEASRRRQGGGGKPPPVDEREHRRDPKPDAGPPIRRRRPAAAAQNASAAG